MFSWFRRITFTCNHCGANQRIPLRRIHFFERFNELREGQPVLIRCSNCLQGLQIPGPTGLTRAIAWKWTPKKPPKNAVIHAHYD